MIPIFDENMPEKYRKFSSRLRLLIIGGVLGWLIASFALILFRVIIGRTLSLIIGIVLTSVVGIWVAEMIRQQWYPKKKLLKTWIGLEKSQGRSLEGTVLGMSLETTTHLGLSFRVMTLQVSDGSKTVSTDLFVWSSTDKALPPKGSRIRCLLSENILMGYALC